MTALQLSDALPGAIAAIRSHPRFREAAAIAASTSVAFYQGNWLANRVVNDRARFVITLVCLFLHFTRRADIPGSGLTATRMREICLNHGVCSAGRAEAMLLMMRAGGYLRPEPVPEDRRVRRYAPTEKLIGLVRERQKRILVAVDMLQSEPRYAAAVESGPGFYPRYAVNLTQGFLDGFRMHDFVPEFERIFDRDAGLIMMMSIVLTDPVYRGLTPSPMQNVTVFGLARRFNVSRAHVRTVLRDAEAAGLVARGDETVRPLPKLVDAIERLLATGFSVTGDSAERALRGEPWLP